MNVNGDPLYEACSGSIRPGGRGESDPNGKTSLGSVDSSFGS